MAAFAARYDKIHMFDVNVSATEIYRESGLPPRRAGGAGRCGLAGSG
jgi:hypothetical protein